MLTSHQYLFGGFVAVSCVTGIIAHRVAASQDLTQVYAEPQTAETVDISYERGSGRLSDQPVWNDDTKERSPLAHRGSGRVRPHPNTI